MPGQYAVIWFPTDMLVADGTGPFRTAARADKAAERLAAVSDHEFQVVPLRPVRDVLASLTESEPPT